MFNDYMLPYQAGVEAGAGSVMASFNEVEGVPATANRWLMTDVLRGAWGFNGFVVTDFTGISEMIEHGIGDLQTVSARAINAGVDMDMVSEGFAGTLKKSIEEGKVSVETVNTACHAILEAKYKLGLFDNPYKYCDLKRPARDIFTKEHRAVARRIAGESFVLLKTDSSLPVPLPSPSLTHRYHRSDRSLGQYPLEYAGYVECGGSSGQEPIFGRGIDRVGRQSGKDSLCQRQ